MAVHYWTWERESRFYQGIGGDFYWLFIPREFADEQLREINADMGGKWLDKDGRWTPTSENAGRAEATVHKFLSRAMSDPHLSFPEMADHPERFAAGAKARCRNQVAAISQKYAQYGIQFAGVTVHGRREILCNYFYLPTPMHLEPSKRFVAVNDGGDLFWHINYAMSTGTCSNFQINGGE